SELARERLGAPKRFAYGPTAIEALDVFTTRVPNAPVSVFVHGGAWRTGLALNYAYAAEMFVNAGAHHVVLDFNNVVETGGDLMVAPVAVVYGTLETPEFQRQSRDFAAAVEAAGKPVTLAVMESYNHFEVMEQLGNPYSLFGRAVLAQMGLSPAP